MSQISVKDKRRVIGRITQVNKDIKNWDKGYIDKIDNIQKRFADVCLKYDAEIESKILADLNKLENQIDKIKKASKTPFTGPR
jgi:hypothetical protein